MQQKKHCRNGDTTPKGILTYKILVCECEMKTQKILGRRKEDKSK